MSATRPARTALQPGLHIGQLVVTGAGHPGQGHGSTGPADWAPRLAQALDAALARRGLHRLQIGRLEVDITGLVGHDPAALARLADRTAQAVVQRMGQAGQPAARQQPQAQPQTLLQPPPQPQPQPQRQPPQEQPR